MATEHLLEEFPPVSTKAWEAAIARDLKGADYEKKLIWRTEEGLAVKPYYRARGFEGPGVPGCGAGRFSVSARSARIGRLADSRGNRRDRCGGGESRGVRGSCGWG